jgi:hypothetical protein
MGRWCYLGGTWRFIIALSMTHLLRFFFTSLFKMRAPEGGDLWKFPGFYSLTVGYGSQNDYYFNSTVAICTLLICEYRQLGLHVLKWISLLALVGDFYLSISLKGSYFIDLFGGVMLGYYIWLATNNWISYYVDVKLFGMTIHERFHIL